MESEMPWMETAPMNEKIKFISEYLEEDYGTFQELCARYKISSKTGYKYVNRYKAEGVTGLEERSRAPHYQANRMPAEIEASIMELNTRGQDGVPRRLGIS